MHREKILIVDDDPFIARILSLTFDKEGYQTVTVMDGTAALETIREEDPDIVFIDVMMPGKNGYDVCRDIRRDTALNRQPYIIMLTARGMASERKRAERSGADEFMTKPFSPTQLTSHVREVLNQQSMGSSV
jgi:two-component system, OmpR family, alkaline phosphatase synthesis response regulator PhoP